MGVVVASKKECFGCETGCEQGILVDRSRNILERAR